MWGRKRLVVHAVALFLAVAACSGGGAGSTVTGSQVRYAGAVSLVDGLVGDTPFADGGNSGLADGRNLEVEGAPVTVNWSPPTLQVNQDPEQQLAGYRVYVGHKPASYDHVIEIGDPSAVSYRLAGLPPGTYYFAVSAVDTGDHEGPLSSAVAITVN